MTVLGPFSIHHITEKKNGTDSHNCVHIWGTKVEIRNNFTLSKKLEIWENGLFLPFLIITHIWFGKYSWGLKIAITSFVYSLKREKIKKRSDIAIAMLI